MQIIHENKLYLNLNKCSFDEQETEYLGVIVGHGQVHMDPVEIAGITDWKTLTDERQVQSCLISATSIEDLFKTIPLLLNHSLSSLEWT
jgi:hypothetical protein